MADYPTLGGAEENQYLMQARRIRQNQGNTLAQSAYARGNAQLGGQRRLEDLATAYDAQRERIPGAAISRGVLHSGIYQEALQKYGTDRLRDYGRAQVDTARTMAGYDLNDDQTMRGSEDQLLDLEEQKQARIREVAASLAGIKPYI